MAITKEVYLQYAKRIVSVLNGDDFYNQYKKRVDEGVANFRLVKKRLIQDISIDWIDTIEEVLPNLDTIVRNPRRFIVQEEDIVDVSLAKAISTESIKHLAQHTNMISKIEDDGTVVPNRILNITKEESFEIYENRFLFTLLLKLKDFVSIRYDKIKKASATQDVLQLDVDSKFNLPTKKVTYRTEYMAQLSFDEVMRLDQETLEKIERIAKIDKIITDFLASSFAKTMRNSAPVRPPITRTNVILKEPNFKKALTLWQFIETYQATGGFSTSDDIEDYQIPKDSQQGLRDMVTLNTMLFESLYDQHETDMSLEDAQFTDLLKVGDLDFGKDELERDQYSQKLDQEELEKEAEKEEEAKPQEDEQKEEEAPKEAEGEKEEAPPPPEIEQEEIEKDVDKNVEVETPPKDEPDEEEPDAEEFDQNLFDVRKLYKRPDDDKLKQEEVARIKDAIDRCLISYRKIKQEEIEQKERDEQMRRRAEELKQRAVAFKLHREQLEKDGTSFQALLSTRGFAQAISSILPQQNVDFAKAHSDLFIKKGEKLDLTDTDIENIRKSIDEMERLKHKEIGRNIFSATEKKVPFEEETEEPLLPTVDIEAQLKARQADKASKKFAKQAEIADNEFGKTEVNTAGNEAAENESAKADSEIKIAQNPAGKAEVKKVYIDKRENKIEQSSAAQKELKPLKPVSVKTCVRSLKAGVIINTVNSTQNNAATPDDLTAITTKIIAATPDDLTAITTEIIAATPDGLTVIPSDNLPISAPLELVNESQNEPAAQPVSTVTAKVKTAAKKAKSDHPRDPWALSSTTLNQRYDLPSGTKKSYKLVDENRVQVGDAPVKRKDIIDILDDTFIEQRARLGNYQKPNKGSAAVKADNEAKTVKKKSIVKSSDNHE